MARAKVKSRPYHYITHLHLQLISLPSINFLHLMVFEIYAGQDFNGQVPVLQGQWSKQG